jgi:hypothetical protein
MSSTWTDVPDPRDDSAPCTRNCLVEISDAIWRKIATKHVTDLTQPWGELLGEWAVRFRGLWEMGVTEETRGAVLTSVSGRVEDEAKRCLRVPLAVLYGEFPPPPAKGHPRDAWSLVLPCGALLAVHTSPSGGEVHSCYFKNTACRERNPHNRWRRLASLLTRTYAEQHTDGTWKARDMSQRDDVIAVRIRFRNPATWCLDQKHPTPWELISDPYHPPPAGAARKLGPRRPC